MNVQSEIYNRIGKLLLDGYTEQQIVQTLLRGEITSQTVSEDLARKWIQKVIEQLDVGDPSKLYKARMQDLYKRTLEKKDYKTALTILKEMQSTDATDDSIVTIEFVK